LPRLALANLSRSYFSEISIVVFVDWGWGAYKLAQRKRTTRT
jgi:hypothetical protein